MSEAVLEGVDSEESAPIPASSVVTPSGIEIEYFTKPRRYYRARAPFVDGFTPVEDDGWSEVPSVTTVLKVLPKDALPWWGMTVGHDAVKLLIQMGVLTVGFDGHQHGLMKVGADHFLGKYVNDEGETKDELTELISAYKLTVNHTLAKAGDRGTGVHDALEVYCAIGQLPNPDNFPLEERGYVRGLLAFLQAAPSLKPEMMEVTVASTEHGYAGRFDLLASVTEDTTVVTKTYPKRKSKVTTIPAGTRMLIDLKTSKHIYVGHLIQLAAYEAGLIECGYGATDARAVLHVQHDGRYEFRQAKATHEDFLSILNTYHTLENLKGALKV